VSAVFVYCRNCREEKPYTGKKNARCPECGKKLEFDDDEWRDHPPKEKRKSHEREYE
jgi:predicted amidophosphoribosyltransferase